MIEAYVNFHFVMVITKLPGSYSREDVSKRGELHHYRQHKMTQMIKDLYLYGNRY